MAMLELVIGIVIAVSITLVVLPTCALKGIILRVRDKHRGKFYELADQIVEWDEITDFHLSHLSFLSRTMNSRRMQFIAIVVVYEVNRKKPTGTSPSASLLPEHQGIWRRMFFHWLTAVCAQGSFVGAAALFQLTKFLDADEADNKVEPPLSQKIAGELALAT
jgi:hypothetical protein